MADINRYAEFAWRWRKIFCFAGILSVVIPALFLGRMNIDNSIEIWLDRDSEKYNQYNRFLSHYGSDEFVVVAIEMGDALSEESLQVQREIADKLALVRGVEQVLDIESIGKALFGSGEGWKDKAGQSDMFVNLLLGDDRRAVGIFLWLGQLKGPDARRKTVEGIEAVVGELAGMGYKTHLAGTPIMNVSLDRSSKKASMIFLPVAIIISILILYLMLRSVAGVIAAMASVGVTVAWTVGLMAMAGKSMNMVTVVLPSLLFILSLSSAIHLAWRYLDHYSRQQGDKKRAFILTFQELARPVCITGITTAVGFSALMVSSMEAVGDFGLFAALGMLLSILFNILIVPGLLSFFQRKSVTVTAVSKETFLGRIGEKIMRRSGLVAGISVILLVTFVILAIKVRVESNVLKFFPEDSRIFRDYTYVGKNLTGFYTIEMDIHTDTLHEPEILEGMKKLSAEITLRPQVARVDHYGRLIDQIKQVQITHLSGPEMMRAGKLNGYLINKFRHQQGDDISLRMSVLVRAMESSEFYALVDFMDTRAGELLPQSAKSNVTGVVSLLNDVQKKLVETQIKSFSLAVVVIIILIGLFNLSVRAAAAAILPNILPVFSVFAIMGVVGIPLDAATVMIASVAIGISADDTIHFLAAYRVQKRQNIDMVQAVRVTLGQVGRAIVFTSIVATAGFCILTLSEFRPILFWGLLTGTTMLTAMICDILILPACVKIFKLWQKV